MLLRHTECSYEPSYDTTVLFKEAANTMWLMFYLDLGVWIALIDVKSSEDAFSSYPAETGVFRTNGN